MIVTKSWLNEWIDLNGITVDELAKTFNAIGLEVDRVHHYTVPKKIVFGKVLECQRHPDADKLNVCRVDLGTSTRQIVCGAANVRQGLLVAVATIGAEMPGGLKIKPVKLRGVESEGMICSSTEIGLPKMNDGIMELDESIGEVTLGEELCDNPYFNDALIEIELTANRGDCLSIYGIARDLSAAYDRPLKELIYDDEGNHRVGIGRILQLSHAEALNVNLRYHAVDLDALRHPFLLNLRLAQVEEDCPNDVEAFLFYATYSSGVILRAYDFSFFAQNDTPKAKVTLKKDENGYAAIFSEERASTVGIVQEDASRVSEETKTVLIEASYIPPDVISKKMAESKVESGPLFYRTSRGSEPRLDLGLQYCLSLFEMHSESAIYGGSIEVCDSYEEQVVSISVEEINAFIGQTIDKTKITQLLKNLGFDIGKSQGESFIVAVPRFRHDIVNKQDIVEEIVRMVGIDNIQSKPFVFAEADRMNGDDYHTYKKRRLYRHRAAQSGFYETVHFVFNERERLEEQGFTCVEHSKELLNPIAGTFDTLRPTLLLGLVDAAAQNVKVGAKQVCLFEVGSVFDAQRTESVKMAMIFSGAVERERLANGGKPQAVDFDHFTQKIADVIGDFELRKHTATHALAHLYQSAEIIIEGKVVGELFKLHPTVQESYDLDATYLCELDFDALPYALTEAKPFSKYQASFRDLSVVMPSSMAFEQIKEVIESSKSDEVIRYYPVDRYHDENLGENVSLTLRFVLQSSEKTLEEEDITSAMSGMLGALESELGLSLR